MFCRCSKLANCEREKRGITLLPRDYTIRDLEIPGRERLRVQEFFHVLSNSRTPWNAQLYFLSPKKLALLSLLEEIKPFPDRKMINI